MALTLLKLTMSSSALTTTTNPEIKNYFYQVPAGGLTNTTFSIDDTSWLDDTGTLVAEGGLTPVSADNGFAQLFINGELQEHGVLTTVSATVVEFGFAASTTIEENKWIVLTVTNFDPDTSTPVIS